MACCKGPKNCSNGSNKQANYAGLRQCNQEAITLFQNMNYQPNALSQQAFSSDQIEIQKPCLQLKTDSEDQPNIDVHAR